MAESVGLGAVWPRAQSDAFCIAFATLRMVFDVVRRPRARDDLVQQMQHLRPAVRQGAHLPQDSSTQKSR